MEKTRVPKGEKYWYIRYNYNIPYELWFVVDWGIEDSDEIVNSRFESGNYFHTQEEAEEMVNKLRAVLNGAEVFEMPSEEEVEISFTRDYDGIYNCAFNAGRKDGIEWLKSKIVK